MRETSKCHDFRLSRGDFDKYLFGSILDIGCGDDPLLPPNGNVTPWDLPNGDAMLLEAASSEVFDCVYSSHCLEHLSDPITALKNWVRVTRPGGFLYIVVPDYTLYEKERWPSIQSGEHLFTFSTHISKGYAGRNNHINIVSDMVPVMRDLGCGLIKVDLEDQGYNYSLPDEIDQSRGSALTQICTIWKKF